MPDVETLQLDGHEVTVHRGGAGRPLVLLHDVLGPLWDGLAAQLAARRTVVLPALAGFPGSAYREDIDTIEDLAFWTLALLEARGLTGVDVVGEGFGGWVAAEVASRWPDAVGRLVLASPFGLRVAAAPTGPLFELRPEGLRAALFADAGSEVARRLSPDMPPSIEGFEWKLVADRAAARVGWRPYLHNPKLAARLARVRQPVLLVWGRANRILPPGPYGEAWQQALPNARIELIDGAGHALGHERPAAVAERIGAFLDR